jgi:hypothetical protein
MQTVTKYDPTVPGLLRETADIGTQILNKNLQKGKN